MSEFLPSNEPSPVQGMAPVWEDPGTQFSPAQPSIANQSAVTAGHVGHNRKASVTRHEAAKRIGSAMGNAQRHLRRSLQLMRNPDGLVIGFPTPGSSGRSVADSSTAVLQEIEERADEIRRDAFRLVEGWRAVAAEQLQQFRSKARAIAGEYPLHTIAATAGSCFFLGVALRLWRQNRG